MTSTPNELNSSRRTWTSLKSITVLLFSIKLKKRKTQLLDLEEFPLLQMLVSMVVLLTLKTEKCLMMELTEKTFQTSTKTSCNP